VKTASAFLVDVDRRWVEREDDRIPLHILGSVALLLRTDYDRGTKDSDVVQTKELTEDIKGRLLSLAGKDTDMHRRHGMYIEVVSSGLPFLPHEPRYGSVGAVWVFGFHGLDHAAADVGELRGHLVRLRGRLFARRRRQRHRLPRLRRLPPRLPQRRCRRERSAVRRQLLTPVFDAEQQEGATFLTCLVQSCSSPTTCGQ
jgi:hypothetical protein